MRKNRIYIINYDDNKNTVLYLRTKIDFYTEAINLTTSDIYQGYNYFQNAIKLVKLNNSLVASSTGNNGLYINSGNVSLGSYYSDYIFIPESDNIFKCSIVEVQDQSIIDMINSKIDGGLKCLNSQEKDFYITQKNKRAYYFKEFKTNLTEPCFTPDGVIAPIEQMEDFGMEDLLQIQNYINSFSSAKTASKNGRDEYGNKVRKRKNKHNKK